VAGVDQFVIAARINDDGLFRHRIADDRAVALQRADGESFANEGGLLRHRGLLDKRGRAIFAQLSTSRLTLLCNVKNP
jgi:hypothetical protein